MRVAPDTDLSVHTTRELCEWLERELDDGVYRQVVDRHAHLALAELENRVNAVEEDVFVLPYEVEQQVKKLKGAGKSTFAAIEKRCKFAWKVWDGKYGPMTPEQAQYATQLLVHCVTKGVSDARAAKEPSKPWPFIYSLFSRVLNHEDTHAGFQRRAGESIDITDALKEALA